MPKGGGGGQKRGGGKKPKGKGRGKGGKGQWTISQSGSTPTAAAANAEVSGDDPPHPPLMKVHKPDIGGNGSEQSGSRRVVSRCGDAGVQNENYDNGVSADDALPGLADDTDDEVPSQLKTDKETIRNHVSLSLKISRDFQHFMFKTSFTL